MTKDEGSSALPIWQDASTQACWLIGKSVSVTAQLKSKYKGNVGAYTMPYHFIIVHVTWTACLV